VGGQTFLSQELCWNICGAFCFLNDIITSTTLKLGFAAIIKGKYE